MYQRVIAFFYFRGKYFCTGKMSVEIEQEQWDSEEPDGINRFRVNFPGAKDQGSPVIMREGPRGKEKRTIIGMFLRMEEDVAIMAQISPSTVNWIRLNADWTQESTCDDPDWRKENLFTSCSCGTSQLTNDDPRRRNRIHNGEAVNNDKQYPWQALVFNKRIENAGLVHTNPWNNGNNFRICSGSIISNKHILTSAECVLKNLDNKQEGYSHHSMVSVSIGSPGRRDTQDLKGIKQVIPHEKAFTEGYNYNIGIYYMKYFMHSFPHFVIFYQQYWQ